MSRRSRNGALHIRSFPDELRDLMAEEIRRSRNEGGGLRSYRDVLVAALVRRYAAHYEAKEAELNHVLRRVRPT